MLTDGLAGCSGSGGYGTCEEAPAQIASKQQGLMAVADMVR